MSCSRAAAFSESISPKDTSAPLSTRQPANSISASTRAQRQFRRGIQFFQIQFFQLGRQHAVQRLHGAGVAVEGSLRRRHIPQQGEGIRFQMDRLYQLRVEIPGEQLPDFIFAAGGVHQIGRPERCRT